MWNCNKSMKMLEVCNITIHTNHIIYDENIKVILGKYYFLINFMMYIYIYRL